ncbi:hypothetical protein CU102_12515 [Phyllobacterium brassicacearum]|uniref:Uncharacterized protein n=2 Tax=Phyllobacterium brassicacearum TaxID=314235 RepID=A0A2P7BQ32_9HYPH|nr:hypothetical protein CU102_12515 [Phyllobacterium brassicacearum]
MKDILETVAGLAGLAIIGWAILNMDSVTSYVLADVCEGTRTTIKYDPDFTIRKLGPDTAIVPGQYMINYLTKGKR